MVIYMKIYQLINFENNISFGNHKKSSTILIHNIYYCLENSRYQFTDLKCP